MKAQINFKNIRAYITGNLRYQLYYSRFKFLIRKHIREQIDWRIEIMDRQCFNQGSCIICGCSTTALQMANKQCDKPCYPEIMSRREWKRNGDAYKKIQKQNAELFFKLITK